MATKSGFQVLKWGNEDIGFANLDNVEEVVNSYRQGRISGIGLSKSYGFHGKNIDFLFEAVPDLEVLIITDNIGLDCSKISGFQEMRLLSVAETGRPLNLKGLVKLRDLSLVCDRKHVFPDESVELDRLYLRGFKSLCADLRELYCFKRLRRLELVGGNFNTLSGVEGFPDLIFFSAAHMRKLRFIGDLFRSNVEEAIFEACRSIEDFTEISKCDSLKVLRVSDCGSLPSLDFLKNFANLEEFRFVKTRILDNDMTPLLKMKRVGFLRHKGYSHTPEEIKRKIGQI